MVRHSVPNWGQTRPVSPSRKRIDPSGGPSVNERVDAGRLADTSLAELLAHGRNTAFSGGLFFRPAAGERMIVSFDQGFITGATGPWENSERLQQSLADLLPTEQLRLAEGHAQRQQLSLFTAVERLSLLPPPTLSSARESLITQGIESLCRLPRQARYAFVAQQTPQSSGKAVHIDALKLVIICAGSELGNGKARAYVESLADRPVQIAEGHLRPLLDTLSGPPRAVVHALGRPCTVHRLVDEPVAPEDQVRATLYGLWLTHELAVGDTRSWSGPPRTHADSAASGTRRLALSDSGRPSTQYSSRPQSRAPGDERSSTWPPNRLTQPPTNPANTVEAAARQKAMEKRVVEAWMASESDPDRTQRAADFVRRAASIYPKNARIQFFAARLDAQTNRLVSAVKRFEQVLELDPNNDDARREMNQLRSTMLPPAKKGFSLKDLFGRGKKS